MRGEFLLLVLFLLSGSTAETWLQAFDYQRYQESSNKDFSCSSMEKAKQVVVDAANTAKEAMDAQTSAAEEASRRVKVMLAERAKQAAKAAKAALFATKRHFEGLTRSLKKNKDAIMEGQRAIEIGKCNLDMLKRLRDSTCKDLNKTLVMVKESKMTRADIRRIAEYAKQEEEDKCSLLKDAKRRLRELKKCRKRTKAELEGLRKLVKKAKCAATEAQERIDTMRKLIPKIKKLKRLDALALRQFLRMRRSNKHT